MNFTRVETAEISDAELDNVAGGIGADVNADVNADVPAEALRESISVPGVGLVTAQPDA